ncbi:MAG: ATP-binding protein [Caldimonas sp.]
MTSSSPPPSPHLDRPDREPASGDSNEVQRSERRLKTLVVTTSAVLWLTSPGGEAVVQNPSWGAFTGQTADEYSGLGWLDAIHPDDRERVRRAWFDAIAAGRLDGLEYRLRRHDGEYRDMVARSVPVFDDAGVVVEWVGSCSDVTEARVAEARLRESEERFRFLDRLGVATRETTDPSEVMRQTAQLLGEHLRASRCAYADVEADNDEFTIRTDWAAPGIASSAGTYSLDLFGPQAAGDMRSGKTLVVRDVDRELGGPGGGAEMFNAIGVNAIVCSPLVKDGRLIAMMAVHQSTPRAWIDDEVLLVEAVVERCWAHIERARDAESLREQDRRKDEFLATLAHELRNPLAPVRYALAMLKAAPLGEEAAAQAYGVLDRQVATMARLIDDLLDLSRVNRGVIDLERERVDLADAVEAAVETTRPLIESRKHLLKLQIPPAGATVLGDRLRLAQILANLLSNAAKYTPDGGTIEVSLWQQDGHAICRVADSGIGIADGEEKSLFRMFMRSTHTAPRAQGGLGIGLALVKQLVDLHGGTIVAHSDGIGRGSRFTLSLPLAAAQPETPRRSARGAAAEAASPCGTRVLAVEDNEDGRASLVALLSASGFDVRSAKDGREAISIAAEFRPAVVLLDIGLPDMTGYDVCAAIRADSSRPPPRIVALTGWGSDADKRRAAAAGFASHLTKPVDPGRLLRLVADLDAG